MFYGGWKKKSLELTFSRTSHPTRLTIDLGLQSCKPVFIIQLSVESVDSVDSVDFMENVDYMKTVENIDNDPT
ncbi:hypothetical protein SYJ56_24260 [Algoriphagus sp. D3-2-R+10]|uniref:hypothetical protein n=1 Tax=Algoriphagus aurantiacus TaxID=3103948 RepID=UPI002B3FE33B|nr:hypothetical protein [Algoriphagus sp. D3-2-R+10]MEB2778446.1 hypothetical protein [Algoriphagus sp. D3-2-R+10]